MPPSYLFDTNILSHLIRQPQGPVAARIAEVGEGNVLTSIVVACELRCSPHYYEPGGRRFESCRARQPLKCELTERYPRSTEHEMHRSQAVYGGACAFFNLGVVNRKHG